MSHFSLTCLVLNANDSINFPSSPHVTFYFFLPNSIFSAKSIPMQFALSNRVTSASYTLHPMSTPMHFVFHKAYMVPVLLMRALPPLFKCLHDYCILQINVHYPHPTSEFVSNLFYSCAILQAIVHLVPYMIIHPVIHNPLSVRLQWY